MQIQLVDDEFTRYQIEIQVSTTTRNKNNIQANLINKGLKLPGKENPGKKFNGLKNMCLGTLIF